MGNTKSTSLRYLSSFNSRVTLRLVEGEKEYEDSSLTLDPSRLLAEIEEELCDVAGWAYLAYARLQGIKAKIEQLESNRHVREVLDEEATRIDGSAEGSVCVQDTD